MSVTQADLTEDEFYRFSPDNAATWPTRIVLREILEAVRALKPERPALSLHDPDFYAKLHERMKPATEPRVFMTAVGPIKVSSADHAETKLLEEIDRVKRGWEADVRLRAEERERLIAENNAVRAAWALDATNLRADVEGLQRRLDEINATNVITSQQECAELKRFREREPLVTKLIGKAICANYPSGTCEAAADVRDFKVTPAPLDKDQPGKA